MYEVKTYAVNQAKWKAAEDFSKVDRRIEFKIITEEELGISNVRKNFQELREKIEGLTDAESIMLEWRL